MDINIYSGGTHQMLQQEFALIMLLIHNRPEGMAISDAIKTEMQRLDILCELEWGRKNLNDWEFSYIIPFQPLSDDEGVYGLCWGYHINNAVSTLREMRRGK